MRTQGLHAKRTSQKVERWSPLHCFMRGLLSLNPMMEWGQIEATVPELAARVRARFESHPHHVLGTLTASGAPRLSGINVFFNDGVLWFGSMHGALKARDLSRDARLSLHSATLSKDLNGGDARVSGVAVPLDGHRVSDWQPESPGDGEYFSVVVDHMHVVDVVGEELVITMWDTRRGLRIVNRQ